MKTGFIETSWIEDEFQQNIIYDGDVGCDIFGLLVLKFDAGQHQQYVILANFSNRSNNWV
jgi:hypothetical protein